MSDLKPTGTKIRLGQKEYGLRFTLNAIEAIQDEYDIPIANLGDLFRDNKNQIKNLKYILMVLINEDIDCMNDETGSKDGHIDEQYVGRHIDASNIHQFTSSVFTSFANGAPRGDGNDPNPVSEQ